jgi:hypothetical protein
MGTGYLLYWACLVSTHHTPGLSHGTLRQVAPALTASIYPGFVARPTIRAVDICSSLSLGKYFFIIDQFLALSLFKLYVFRLWGTAGPTGLLQAGVNRAAIWAGPL